MINPDDIIWLDKDGVIHIRNSERGTLDKCPQRWWWSWRDGLRPKETPKALWFGTAIHEALADYYQPGRKRSKDFIDKFREYADMEGEYIRTNVGVIDEEAWVDARTLGEQMLLNYRKHYDGDRDWDVIGTEQPFSVRIPVIPKSLAKDEITPLMRRLADQIGSYFILNGTMDGVYRDLGDRKKAKLMEHKTAATISVRHLPMDNQAGTYWMTAATVGRAAGWLKPNENIAGITYNFLRKALPDDRPKDAQGYATNKPTKEAYLSAIESAGLEEHLPRLKKDWLVVTLAAICADAGIEVIGERSKSQPAPLFERHPVRKSPGMRKTQLRRLQDEFLRMAAYVYGELPVTKSPSRDTCPMCPFSEMCESHESGSNWVSIRDALFRREDLYADHYMKKSA